MSPINEDNLGRRRFLLHRDKAVEHALERVRHAGKSEWEFLSAEERATLKSGLAEIWINTTHERWHQYCFSTLTRKDILELVALCRDIKVHHRLTDETFRSSEAILLHCSHNNHPR